MHLGTHGKSSRPLFAPNALCPTASGGQRLAVPGIEDFKTRAPIRMARELLVFEVMEFPDTRLGNWRSFATSRWIISGFLVLVSCLESRTLHAPRPWPCFVMATPILRTAPGDSNPFHIEPEGERLPAKHPPICLEEPQSLDTPADIHSPANPIPCQSRQHSAREPDCVCGALSQRIEAARAPPAFVLS